VNCGIIFTLLRMIRRQDLSFFIRFYNACFLKGMKEW